MDKSRLDSILEDPLRDGDSLRLYLEKATFDQCFALGASLHSSLPDLNTKRRMIQSRIDELNPSLKKPKQGVIMDFRIIKKAVAQQFALMSKGRMFRVQMDRNELTDLYLASFPEGTNPIYRERTEHDCSACRHFIRSVGNVVSITDDNQLVSIWDIEVNDPAYQTVANALAALVKSRPIVSVFLSSERTAGVDENREWSGEVGKDVITWSHFFVNIPHQFVKDKRSIGPSLADAQATHDVMLRGLNEITMDSVDMVLELISQNSLYRGQEHRHTISEFRTLLYHFQKLADVEKDNFVWSHMQTVHQAISRIRNTSIGTLLVYLSNGEELERAVGAFEAMVAPTNYKRPTALVTKSMVEDARKKIDDLGLTSALGRRFAGIDDIQANDMLFVDRDTARTPSTDPFDSVATVNKKTYDKVEEITIDDFLDKVLPSATSLEVMLENRHGGNLVSLTTADDPTSGLLFKWGNRFAWSYNGDVTDSIKEKVKKAGGNVTGDLCCRLSWFNFDDLDLHMFEPDNAHISYSHKGPTRLGGRLDVDMNAGSGHTREAVENIFYQNERTMQEGIYTLKVNNFCKRENKDEGFTVEIDYKGKVWSFNYDRPVRDKETIEVAQLKHTKAGGIEIVRSLPESKASRIMWSIPTQEFTRIKALMLSPNFWGDNRFGNKHYFFMLEGCVNDQTTRGFYNEFLREDLTPHRKVFEMVGSKVRTELSQDQLSGLGFSSTQRDHVLVRVSGKFTRVLKVKF